MPLLAGPITSQVRASSTIHRALAIVGISSKSLRASTPYHAAAQACTDEERIGEGSLASHGHYNELQRS